MAVKIRLKRMGTKKKPFYRIVVADSRAPRDGKVIEEVGTYNPLETPAVITVKKEQIMKWLSNGAQPTDTVKAIFTKMKINEEFHNLKNASKPKSEKKATTKKTTTKKTVKKD